ncbi:MAG: hypothetical protein OXC07_13440 [Kistimonas sp.]|nr:hypothetical protein [Kistimonas sp.]
MRSPLVLSIVVGAVFNPVSCVPLSSAEEAPPEPQVLETTALGASGAEEDEFESEHGGRCAEGKCGEAKKYGQLDVDSTSASGRVSCARDGLCGIAGGGGASRQTPLSHLGGQVRPGVCSNS